MKRIRIFNHFFEASIDGVCVKVYEDRGYIYLRSDRVTRNAQGRKTGTVPRTCRMRAREFAKLLGGAIDGYNGAGRKGRR